MARPGERGWDAESAYDRMAVARARVLGAPWPAVARFLAGLPRGTVVLDVGVGNGRYLRLPESVGLRFVGVDLSREQLRLAASSCPAGSLLARGDARALPVKTGEAGAALAVALVHHFPDRPDRVRALLEVARALAGGAPWLASAWADSAAFARGARRWPGGGRADVAIAFREGLEEPVERFFHLYGEGELSAEAAEAGLRPTHEALDAGNRFATGRAPPRP